MLLQDTYAAKFKKNEEGYLEYYTPFSLASFSTTRRYKTDKSIPRTDDRYDACISYPDAGYYRSETYYRGYLILSENGYGTFYIQRQTKSTYSYKDVSSDNTSEWYVNEKRTCDDEKCITEKCTKTKCSVQSESTLTVTNVKSYSVKTRSELLGAAGTTDELKGSLIANVGSESSLMDSTVVGTVSEMGEQTATYNGAEETAPKHTIIRYFIKAQ